MQLFRKPNLWFGLYVLSTPILTLLLLLHMLTAGAFNGMGLIDAWAGYTIKKGRDDSDI